MRYYCCCFSTKIHMYCYFMLSCQRNWLVYPPHPDHLPILLHTKNAGAEKLEASVETFTQHKIIQNIICCCFCWIWIARFFDATTTVAIHTYLPLAWLAIFRYRFAWQQLILLIWRCCCCCVYCCCLLLYLWHLTKIIMTQNKRGTPIFIQKLAFTWQAALSACVSVCLRMG